MSLALRLAPCGSNVLYASGAAGISIFEPSGEAADLLALQQLSTGQARAGESPSFMALATNFDPALAPQIARYCGQAQH